MDATKIIDVNKVLEKFSNTDEVTKLPNRRCFITNVENCIKSYNNNNTNFGIIFIELEDLQNINKKYGYTIQNKLLMQYGKLLNNLLTENELLFRISDDKFIILIKCNDLIEQINYLENELDKLFGMSLIIEGEYIKINSSYGSNLYSESNSLDNLIKKANKNMIKMKTLKTSV